MTVTLHRPATLAVHYDFAAADGGALAGSVLRLLGVHPGSSGVWVDDDILDVTFGRWRVTTPLDNIAAVDLDGPFAPWRVIGPRVGVTDRSLTFGTTARSGARIRFREPVPGIEPTGLVLHPTLTVTVERPYLLVRRLRRAVAART